MVSPLETAMTSGVMLFILMLHSAYGTFFPPVSDRPPIPAQAVRTLNSGSQGFYVQEDSPQDFAQSFVREEGLFSSDTKPDDQRWFLQENQSDEGGPFSRSAETFDRYYQSGEPAVGPVATPIPDDAYIAQPSSIARLNPSDQGSPEVWILTRGSENRYIPDRWVQVQAPAERVVEIVNQDSGPPPVATDPVKSVIAPAPSDIPVKTYTPNSPGSIVQQVWVQTPKVVDSAPYGKSASFVGDISSVQQIVDVPQANGKQIVQQQIFKDVPPPVKVPAPAPVLNAKTFSVPPPLPPPIKGDVASKSIPPANVIPDSNVIIGGKNPSYQRLRHVWIPTSSRTGKFITFPVSASIDSRKSVVNALPTPITVSDTWVLKQDGPLPGFEQQKSALPPPVVQTNKVVIQNPPAYQVKNPPTAQIIAQIAPPKAQIGKGVLTNAPVNVWPVSKDVGSKVSGKSTGLVPPDLPVSTIKSSAVGINKGLAIPPIAPQKSVIKSVIPPPVPPPSVQIINGKPCPLPPPVPQKSIFPAPNPPVISLPRVIGTSRLPITRIVRVNRYPTGNYYLLNTRIRPNYFTYPNPAVIQQPNAGLIQIVQPQQVPFQLQGKQPIVPVQAKRIAIPAQSKQFVAPVPSKQVAYPFLTRQAIISLPQKPARVIYPAIQAIQYPWSGLSNYRLIPGKGVLIPQLSPLKALSPASKSSSSSSESSSESSSSESGEKKKEKAKKEEKKEEKSKESESEEEKEEKPESGESSSSSEGEKESDPGEKESEESTSESKTEEESIEAAESQILHAPANRVVLANFEHLLNQEPEIRVTTSHGHNYPEEFYSKPHHEAEPRTESHESTHINFIPNHPVDAHGVTNQRLEGSTDNLTTEFDRD